VYLKHQSKAADAVGIRFEPIALPADAGAKELAALTGRLGADPTVDGVLVEHPLPPSFDFLGAVARLPVEKDVDGVGPANLGRLLARRPVQVPAVALAALRVAQHYGIAVAGRRVAVVGRSETVGLPLALLLLGRGPTADATVTVAHSKTPDLAAALLGSEVVFSCAGQPGLLDRSVVPKGAAVIDIGLSTTPDPTRPSGVRIVGDADAASLDGWASALTPVPGGVGPVTVACLMGNAVRGWELLHPRST
jgi:methylenetetrahydrofolate dehydrogenase (NADP+)/methenyltetrahydrofolate cyclohydrolase